MPGLARACSSSNSAAPTTTTASRPRTVTRWGRPDDAKRTTSLNFALASASFQAKPEGRRE